MTETPLPRKILVASDLSARSDRALTRAAQLAAAWQCEVTVAHVVHPIDAARHDRADRTGRAWLKTDDFAAVQGRKLQDDLVETMPLASSRILLGPMPDTLLQLVDDEAIDLVILGIAKDAAMERIKLGSTVDAMLRQSKVPVMNVRNRGRRAYRHVAIATDFSETARCALRVAAHWFGQARLTLFHAYELPGAIRMGGPAARDAWRGELSQYCASHVAGAGLPPMTARSISCILAQGTPGPLLSDYVVSTDVDLVVLGSQGRSGLARIMLGSTAEHLLHSIDCDTLVVRGG